MPPYWYPYWAALLKILFDLETGFLSNTNWLRGPQRLIGNLWSTQAQLLDIHWIWFTLKVLCISILNAYKRKHACNRDREKLNTCEDNIAIKSDEARVYALRGLSLATEIGNISESCNVDLTAWFKNPATTSPTRAGGVPIRIIK